MLGCGMASRADGEIPWRGISRRPAGRPGGGATSTGGARHGGLEKSKKHSGRRRNVDAADTLEVLLGMDGFTVTTVYDGVAAVAQAGSSRPDVVVMDTGMPSIDSYDAARLIRQQPGGEKSF